MHDRRFKKHGDPLIVKTKPRNPADAVAKRCTRCGIVKPLEDFGVFSRNNDGRHGHCRECARVALRAWKQRDPEAANRWRTENRERYLALQRDYNQRTKAQQRPAKRRYERLKRLGHNPEALAYDAVLRGDPCCYCGARPAEIDHIAPRGVGPRDDSMNLTAACHACNASKRQKTLLQFLLHRKDLLNASD